MKQQNTNNSSIFPTIAILLVIAAAFVPMLNSFFQQDEWIAFGFALSRGEFSLIRLLSYSLAPNPQHYVPLLEFTFGILFKIIGFNFFKWMTLSIVLHVFSTFLVGKLLSVFFKSNHIVWLGMLLFGLSGAASQATTWAVVDINTQVSCQLAFVSFLILFKSDEKVNRKLTLTSVIFLYASLLFKEVSIGMFLVIPLALWIWHDAPRLRSLGKHLFTWFIYSVPYILLRIVVLLLPHARSAGGTSVYQSPALFVYNLATTPLKVFLQALIPQRIWYQVGNQLAILPGRVLHLTPHTTEFDHFVQARFLEGVFIFCAFIGVIVLSRILIKNPQVRTSKIVIISLIFIVLNSFVYAFSPERTGVVTYIDSRNLYFPLFGCILFLLAIIRNFRLRWFWLISLTLLVINVTVLFKEEQQLILEGRRRSDILIQMKAYFPTLSDKTIFYVQSNSSYYGLPESMHIPPFQSGFGQTLLVWYSDVRPLPTDFYSNYYLWALESQGYKEHAGRGFGYFREYPKLLETVRTQNIPIENVLSVRWEHDPEALINETEAIQWRLKSDLGKK